MKIVKKKLTELKPAKYNPRKISKNDEEKLVKSIQRWGLVEPIIWNERTGNIVGGHQRMAVLLRTQETETDVVVVDLPETEEKALNIALNKISGDWDADKLTELLKEIKGSGLDLELTGFDYKGLKDVLGKDGALGLIALGEKKEDFNVPSDDDVKKVVTSIKVGDRFRLGKNYLMCGDARDIEQVKMLMEGMKAKLVLTDPPYNTWMSPKKNYDSTWLSHMFEDDYTDEEYHDLLLKTLSNYAEILESDTALYVFLDWRRMHELIPIIKQKFKFSNLIVWDKVVHGLGSDYKYTYELIAVAKIGKPELQTHQNEEYKDIWHVQREIGRNKDHATAKPLDLLEIPLRHATKQGEVVVDLFGGSGSTLIACEQNSRVCYMMELDPQYCQVIIDRWEKYTGQKAEKIQ